MNYYTLRITGGSNAQLVNLYIEDHNRVIWFQATDVPGLDAPAEIARAVGRFPEFANLHRMRDDVEAAARSCVRT